nr:RNA-directed DNA polymerase, eukaryota [Tanacetum cinerariifolium]
MIVVVYAPQEASEKRMLWDYVIHISNQWRGDIVIMGDFNEIRHNSKRFGSKFNAHNANIFNSFISNAGLNKVHLGGNTFTWCHKSSKKMSKLDRFLVSNNVLMNYPNINAISLDRFISDHRPILLREGIFDYGPIPFRFYSYWLEVDSFDKMVKESWNNAPSNKNNAIRSFMYKLKYTKEQIRGWLSANKRNMRGELHNLKDELRMIDEEIDKAAQKAKVRWVVDGDENSKFFHADMFKVVDFFFTYGEISIGCNSNFIALIPKTLDANMVKDFRPISLIGGLYKVIAKVLTNRLVNVIGDLVNEVQSAFVAERQILDGKIQNAATKLGCLILKTPYSYLGTKIGANMARKEAWKEVVDKVLTSKEKGGLGVSSLYALNRGLMFKWIWRFYTQKSSLWTRVIKAIHGDGRKLSKDTFNGNLTGWITIIKEIRMLKDKGVNVMDFIRLKLGNDPSLVNSFRRQVRSGVEENKFNELLRIVQGTTLAPCVDCFIWSLESDGIFSVASIRKCIDNSRFQEVGMATRWIKSIPSK